MVLKTWITEYRKMYIISDKSINFIMNAIENWKVELKVEGRTIEEV